MTGTNGEPILLSIIIPSFNQGHFIENAILSVTKQSYQNWELIIQDGNSGDETAEICLRYTAADPRISFVSEPDRGYADAVNKALKRCRGTVAAIQSSDDFYASDSVFSEAARIFRQHPALVMVSGYSVLADADFRQVLAPFDPQQNGFIRPETVFTLTNHFAQGATFFSVARALLVGGLDAEVDMVADTDFWVRLSNYHPAVVNSVYRTSQTWACVTIHEEQRSTKLHRFYLGRAKMALRHLRDDRIRLDHGFKERNAMNLIATAYDYYRLIGEDTAPVEELRQSLGASSPCEPLWRRVASRLGRGRRIAEDSSMHSLTTHALGHNLKWF
ncbi:glycosyltransferase [Geomonas oryzisoli]|uniref:Glycosyltransferase n=1 Tax=Geomonas oryzisoli TaxID=2847992 RepID=A0ABX8JBW8_9BACT|nr:glycosyltransferase [Geomonas oryzisoli]QWV95069.1 glycosyltransferase [Geomonas oryzisoli]